MADDQQMATRRDQFPECSEQFPACWFKHVEELRRHQIERAALRIPLGQVCFQPLDIDVRALDMGLCATERYRRNIGAGDFPPTACQPQSVGALAAAHVERCAGLEV